ncbi:mtDNA inheritance, partitioning of the mitochondrial organelle [Entomortierella chlamydospora]|uniref:MtDNA inheritance, partitioning of the mitochondrial organelle n=1 Tax=Entomortierella chlamydospora TaxID=101097 RepID=A0A9P6N0L7_9FUNG|nr:mtDNA inheritance, partitioning of the mitochondrial organelle [Entomortierella chlamydospora]
MYYSQAQHHRVDDFSPTSTPPASSELRLYTWENATLGEITSLVKQAIPDLVAQAGSGGQLAFRHIFLDVNRGIFVGRDVGTVRLDNSNALSSSAGTGDSIPAQGLFTKDIHNTAEGARSIGKGAASTPVAKTGTGGGSKAYEKTLESFRFVIGDYLDIAITSLTAPGFIPPSVLRQQQQHGPGGGGPIRSQRGGPRSGGGRHGGGGAGGGGAGGGERMDPLGDRFASRLGLSRNGHGQGFGGRKNQGSLDVHNEPSWKGRGRPR